MGAFYGTKISNAETNQKTGKAWTLSDVPAYWKSKTEEWIKNK